MANEEAITIATHQLNQPNEYDGFLSFRVIDTQIGFTGNLYNALHNKRFKIYMDVNGFKSGDQIFHSLLKALEGSSIAIVVFSENYLFSTYCLDELVKMVECKKLKNQQILPIFYDVDPSEVRLMEGRFGEAMSGHEHTFGKDSEKIQMWKSALFEVTNLNGWHFKIGEDTRYSFTGHVYDALVRAGFKIFMKDKECDPNSQSFARDIEKSRLSIIVISENYAYASPCLDELVTVLELMKTKNQLVWPIFYKVDPSDIRNQRKSYGKAMIQHENKFGKDYKKLQSWRLALFEVANLKGWHLKFGVKSTMASLTPSVLTKLLQNAGKRVTNEHLQPLLQVTEIIPQVGQFFYVTRFDSDDSCSVPLVCGLNPLPKRRACVGNPIDLVSSDCLHNNVKKRKENNGSHSNVNKNKNKDKEREKRIQTKSLLRS
ncbi:hypothetical protein TSUD_258620 [Trifolium subterraneum]|uniref:TIR domain-containing protein n=1 Tax=Trifolium subterraneum TaxID=3900 RepID=A0A2Z6P893_TRISU|nr:hypothetical protein TSUD_258620 [Trifolium subterraneum]